MFQMLVTTRSDYSIQLLKSSHFLLNDFFFFFQFRPEWGSFVWKKDGLIRIHARLKWFGLLPGTFSSLKVTWIKWSAEVSGVKLTAKTAEFPRDSTWVGKLGWPLAVDLTRISRLPSPASLASTEVLVMLNRSSSVVKHSESFCLECKNCQKKRQIWHQNVICEVRILWEMCEMCC